jgi:glutamate dehydrogenase/glutamate dehydrogenase (NAD(P)+)
MLENECLVHLPLETKWETVRRSIELRIRRNMAELCGMYDKDPQRNPYDHALDMAEKRLVEAMVETSRLEAKTKSINQSLDNRFKVYTK